MLDISILILILLAVYVLPVIIREIVVWYRDPIRVGEFIEDSVWLAVSIYSMTLGSELADRKSKEAKVWYLRRRHAAKSY